MFAQPDPNPVQQCLASCGEDKLVQIWNLSPTGAW